MLILENVEIFSIAACTPASIRKSEDFYSRFGADVVKRAESITGISQRRILQEVFGCSDLSVTACKSLLDFDKNIKSHIRALVSVTQTPDYRQPGDAFLIHKRLGLREDTASFDINIACSGYVYGLFVAASLAKCFKEGFVLLTSGECASRYASPHDAATALLFGDASSATLVRYTSKKVSMKFSLNTDGHGSEFLNIKGGGYKSPQNSDESHGPMLSNAAATNYLHMDGLSVFRFTLSKVVEDLRVILNSAGLKPTDINWFIPHQSNRYLMNHLAKGIGLEQAKMLSSIENFGNTTSASIPLTISYNCLSHNLFRECILLSGYGSGLSWGSAIVDLTKTNITSPSELSINTD